MSLRSKIKQRIRETIDNLGILAKVLHDESQYPGRPQPHMAARHPLWGGEDSPPVGSSVGKTEQVTEQVQGMQDTPVSSVHAGSSTGTKEEYWFLQDAEDDWSRTNPKSP